MASRVVWGQMPWGNGQAWCVDRVGYMPQYTELGRNG
jgi:hypothetical protein